MQQFLLTVAVTTMIVVETLQSADADTILMMLGILGY
jgi:hypothetical protein